MPSLFAKPITELKGVGTKRAELFKKLGAPTAGALLRLYPRAYEDWSNPCAAAEAPLDTPCTVRATVETVGGAVFARSGVMLIKARAADLSGNVLDLVFFNNPYIPRLLTAGQTYLFHGKVTRNRGQRQMVSPLFAEIGKAPGLRPIRRGAGAFAGRDTRPDSRSAAHGIRPLRATVCARKHSPPAGPGKHGGRAAAAGL